MSDEAIAAAVEQFVKKVSFAAQREVEKLGLNTTIYSKIEL
jgi:hypothetical protein